MGARIRERRLALGLTLRELSRRCGVKESALGNLEQRDSKKSDRASAIAGALDVSATWLVDGVDDSAIRAPHTDEEREILQLWRQIEPTEREQLLSNLRSKIESYRRVAAHLASIGVNLDAPAEHAAPYPRAPSFRKR